MERCGGIPACFDNSFGCRRARIERKTNVSFVNSDWQRLTEELHVCQGRRLLAWAGRTSCSRTSAWLRLLRLASFNASLRPSDHECGTHRVGTPTVDAHNAAGMRSSFGFAEKYYLSD